MSSTGKVLLGLLAGVSVGATLGVLFAPDKGSSTRRKISSRGEKYAHDMENKIHGVMDNVSNKFESVKEDAARWVKSGKSKVEEAEGRFNAGIK